MLEELLKYMMLEELLTYMLEEELLKYRVIEELRKYAFIEQQIVKWTVLVEVYLIACINCAANELRES